jgi:hypothetical protein
MFITLVVAASMLVACGDGPKMPQSGGDTAAATPRPNPTANSAADSIASRQAHKSTIDSAMLAPPPPLAKAPASLAADTIPLHAPDGSPARYGLRSGRIVYRFTGNSRGERRIVFDQWGMRERRDEKTEPYPEGTSGSLSNVILITTPEEQAYADNRTKHGYRTPNEGLKRYMEMGASKTKSLGAMIMEQSGAERLADTTIAGYHCRVLRKEVKGMTITDWLWRGIVLREHVISPEEKVEYTIEPIEVTPNVALPDSTFSFPSDYVVSPYTAPGGR